MVPNISVKQQMEEKTETFRVMGDLIFRIQII